MALFFPCAVGGSSCCGRHRLLLLAQQTLRARNLREVTVLLALSAVFLFLLYAKYPLLSLPPTQPSLVVSFGDGRLGNQMSSLATLLGLQEQYGVDPLVTMAQAKMLFHYFTLGGEHGVQILEQHYPDWKRFRWTSPFT